MAYFDRKTQTYNAPTFDTFMAQLQEAARMLRAEHAGSSRSPAVVVRRSVSPSTEDAKLREELEKQRRAKADELKLQKQADADRERARMDAEREAQREQQRRRDEQRASELAAKDRLREQEEADALVKREAAAKRKATEASKAREEAANKAAQEEQQNAAENKRRQQQEEQRRRESLEKEKRERERDRRFEERTSPRSSPTATPTQPGQGSKSSNSGLNEAQRRAEAALAGMEEREAQRSPTAARGGQRPLPAAAVAAPTIAASEGSRDAGLAGRCALPVLLYLGCLFLSALLGPRFVYIWWVGAAGAGYILSGEMGLLGGSVEAFLERVKGWGREEAAWGPSVVTAVVLYLILGECAGRIPILS